MAEIQGTVVIKALRGMLGAMEKPGFAVAADAVTGLKPLRKETGLLCGEVLLLSRDRTLQHTRVSLLETVGFTADACRMLLFRVWITISSS